jgi:hypothetical protein
MSEVKSDKPNIHINATPEVSEILGLNKVKDDHDNHSSHSKKAHEPANLPVIDSEVLNKETKGNNLNHASHKPVLNSGHAEHSAIMDLESLEEAEEKAPAYKKAFKTASTSVWLRPLPATWSDRFLDTGTTSRRDLSPTTGSRTDS